MIRHLVTASVLLVASVSVRVEAQEQDCCGPCDFKACVGGVDENAKRSSELFFGTVVAEELLACCDSRADVTFKVIRRWKGAEIPRVVIRTEACAGLYPFALGRNYLVFASGTPPLLSRCFPPHEGTAADQAMAKLDSLREATGGPLE
jgi:hypothetical protein